MIKELKPIQEKTEDWEPIQEILLNLFRELIYQPLLNLFPKEQQTEILKNSLDDLVWAVRAGRISHYRGRFSGRFNATLTKEIKKLGGQWKNGAWHIPLSDLPESLADAIRASESAFDRALEEINKKLREGLPKGMDIDFTKVFDKTIFRVEKDFQKSIKNITVAPKLTKEQAKQLSKEYSRALNLPIQGWMRKEVYELRQEVEKHVKAGGRQEALAALIKRRHGVGESKAKFLARQETNLLVAKFREVRYGDAGIREYKWRAVVGTKLHPTRKRHSELSKMSAGGVTFRWSDPPVTTEPGQPVRRNNPGQDYNCRCIAIPVVKFK